MSSPDVTVQLPATLSSIDTSLRDLVADPGHGPDTGPLKPGQTFGPRYHIIRLLGIGGMGAVYHAWDTELAVSVAIKVIRPEIMANPTAGADVERRFKRELLLARQVTHKNVVRIHDLGEIDRIKYITMSYVNGVDLATKLKELGRLPVEAVMPLARAIVSGLVAAHAAGVVHRDLKPANIMMGVNGDTLIMDFGIARSSGGAVEAAAVTASLPEYLQAAAEATVKATLAPTGATPIPSPDAATMATPTSAATATGAGGIVGTVQYMAPEQASGLAVDQRADIYAFGLILYDALTGLGRHSTPDGPIAELRARMQQAPPGVRTLVPEVPEPLERLIARCLDPLPEKRFQTTEELDAEFATLNDKGGLIPIKRVFGVRSLAAIIVVSVGLVGGGWWYAKSLIPPPVHEAVQVVIADFKNLTGDMTFDHTLEPIMRRALETSSFISAYDRTSIAATGARPPAVLDENAARELAVKQGLPVVLSGTIDRQSDEYNVSVKAVRTVTGEVVVDKKGRAAAKNDVLGVATKLVADVRKALGDEVPQSQQLFAMRSLSAGSLEVLSFYAAAIQAQAKGDFEAAKQSYLKAVEVDPMFGLGYQGLAVMSRNLSRPDDAEKYIKQALKYLDGMTDREKFGTRGFYYRLIGDNQQCAKEYGLSLAQYPADTVAHNQRAGCLVKLKNMKEAMAEMRQAVQMLPNHTGYRTNLALVATWATDFEVADSALQKLPTNDIRALQVRAYSQVGRGLLTEAADTYQKISQIVPQGPSQAALGLGDLAVYRGRFAEAIRIFEPGAAADLAAKNSDRAAIKFTSSAFAHLMSGHPELAIKAADTALQHSKSFPVRFLAARIYAEAGAIDKARPLAAAMSAELPAEPQAHGKIIEGLIQLKSGKARDAIKTLTDANTLLDTWFGRFDLGRAYLAAGAFVQADAEFDRCIARRGEALSLMDEGPTYGYFPFVYYYQGLVREQMGTARFADSYREYLRLRAESQDDPLLPDVRKRAGY